VIGIQILPCWEIPVKYVVIAKVQGILH